MWLYSHWYTQDISILSVEWKFNDNETQDFLKLKILILHSYGIVTNALFRIYSQSVIRRIWNILNSKLYYYIVWRFKHTHK